MTPAVSLRLILIAFSLLLPQRLLWSIPAPASAKPGSPEEYRSFAMQKDGDPVRGRNLFNDEQRLACIRCHSIDGSGSKAGPDLARLGDTFSRREIVDAILHPSAVIAVGYSTTVVETRQGESHQGVLKQATADWIELAGGDGKRMRIPRADILSQTGSSVSLMPEGLQASVTLAEFDDLIEYLVTLKEPTHAVANQRGMPADIRPLAKPVLLQPFLNERIPVSKTPEGTKPTAQYGIVWFEQVPGQPAVFLALDQSGLVWRLEKRESRVERTLFLDLSREVFSARGPNGLLGLAFHPKFKANRTYFLKYQVYEKDRIVTLLVRRKMSADFSHDSGEPGERILEIPAIAEHHNGGCMRFGPDGFLYVGMGDSAPNHDPQGHSQDMRMLLGKMLRLDVDHRDPGLNYAIPRDNPFVGRPETRGEIWASGLREPWRFSFDAATGELWVADLGQERGDEISIVRRGENHGWNVYEGFELFSHQHERRGVDYIAPIFSTRRKQGITLIGGHVYHGGPGRAFQGVYVFGDYGSRRIWGMTQENRQLRTIRELAVCPEPITAFAVDDSGVIYAVGYAGMIHRLDFSQSDFGEEGR